MSSKEQYVAEHFPEANPGARPCGARIIVQLRTVKEKSQGGIILAQETKEFNNGNTQIGRVVAVGPIAFCNRETGQPWTEGVWAKVGDIVVMPRWGGFRYEVPVPGSESKAIFAVFDDTNVQLVVEDNFQAFDQLL